LVLNIKKNEENGEDNLRTINNQSVVEEPTIEQFEEKALEGEESKPNAIRVN
jgi:hypothetical protein